MYKIIDCLYNQEYYPSLVGQVMADPPSTAIAVEID